MPPRAPRPGRRSRGDRMLRRVLDRTGAPQQVCFVDAGRDDDVGERHAAFGDGAGLVEHRGVDELGRLEHLSALDDDAELRAPTRADHDRGRGGESERARAGDDQHRDRGRERLDRRCCRAATTPRGSRPRSPAPPARTPPRCGRPAAAPGPSTPGPPRPAGRSGPARCHRRPAWLRRPAAPTC